MSRKSRRSDGLSLVLDDIDDILGVSRPLVRSPSRDSQTTTTSSPRSPTSGCAHKRQRAEHDDSVQYLARQRQRRGGADLVAVVGSDSMLGCSELDLLQRKEEEVADMVLFLAQTVQRARSLQSLTELAQHVASVGVVNVINALKQAGLLEQFIAVLCTCALVDYNVWPEMVRFLDAIVNTCPPHALYSPEMVQLCCRGLRAPEPTALSPRDASVQAVQSTQPQESEVSTSSSCGSSAMTPSTARQHAHWSCRKGNRKSITSPAMLPEEQQRKVLADAIATVSSTRESATTGEPLTVSAFCVSTLLQLTLLENTSDSAEQRRLVSEAFASSTVCTDFSAVLRTALHASQQSGTTDKEREHGAVPLSLLLKFMETATVSFRASTVMQLGRLVMDDLVHGLFRDTTEHSSTTLNMLLRVITNVTNVHPGVLHGAKEQNDDSSLRKLSQFSREVLIENATGSSTDAEMCTFVLCICINIIKWENSQSAAAEGGSPLFLESLKLGAKQDWLLRECVERLLTLHTSAATEDVVLAGYYAVFIAVVSLSHAENIRVRTITCIAQAWKVSRPETSCPVTPMSIVLAVIQEFILFQSSSHVLTREALSEMMALVDKVAAANNIEIKENFV